MKTSDVRGDDGQGSVCMHTQRSISTQRTGFALAMKDASNTLQPGLLDEAREPACAGQDDGERLLCVA